MTATMKYSMEAAIEAERLEEQVFHQNYTLSEELGRFKFEPEEQILDAGCGTGVLARYLVEKLGVKRVDAVDYSDLRLKQASDLSRGKTKEAITFFRQDLSNLDRQFLGRYDTVICRYVIEHCEDPLRVLGQLHKALKPGGRLIIYELDGVFVNLYSRNQHFNDLMDELKRGLKFDLYIGRKLPSYFKEVGFSDIQWEPELINCKGRRLEEERVNTVKRFAGLTAFLANLFGSADKGEEFKRLYLDEMVKPENTLVFNKYVCIGKKR